MKNSNRHDSHQFIRDNFLNLLSFKEAVDRLETESKNYIQTQFKKRLSQGGYPRLENAIKSEGKFKSGYDFDISDGWVQFDLKPEVRRTKQHNGLHFGIMTNHSAKGTSGGPGTWAWASIKTTEKPGPELLKRLSGRLESGFVASPPEPQETSFCIDDDDYLTLNKPVFRSLVDGTEDLLDERNIDQLIDDMLDCGEELVRLFSEG